MSQTATSPLPRATVFVVDGRPGGDTSALEDASALEAVTSVVASTITRQVT